LPKFGYRGELALTQFPPLIYLRSRTYDAAVGRFTTRDPVLLPGGLTQPTAPYAYAGNDPLSQIDPLGSMYVSLGGGTSAPTGVSNQVQSAANSATKNALVDLADALTALENELRSLAQFRGRSGITVSSSDYAAPNLPIVGQWGIQLAHLGVYLNDQQTAKLTTLLQLGLSVGAAVGAALTTALFAGGGTLAAVRALNAALGAEAALGTASAEAGAAAATAAAVAALDVAIAGAIAAELTLLVVDAGLIGIYIQQVNAQGGNMGVVLHFDLWRWWHTASTPVLSLPWTPFHPTLKAVGPWEFVRVPIIPGFGDMPTLSIPVGTVSPQ
jgi:RHS repeat-associated protein